MFKEGNVQFKEKRNGCWTHKEHQLFVDEYGKDWAKILEIITTRSAIQIRSHAQKYFNKLENKFESWTVLGKDSETIIGSQPQNKQFRVFLNVVQPKIINRDQQITKETNYSQKDEISQSNTKIKHQSQTFQNQNFNINQGIFPEHQSFFSMMILQNNDFKKVSQHFMSSYTSVDFIDLKLIKIQDNSQKHIDMIPFFEEYQSGNKKSLNVLLQNK